jgi:TonB family protein
LTFASVSLAQTPHDQEAQTRTPENIPIEVFLAPRPKNIAAPDCDEPGRRHIGACEALLDGAEGWVELGFMVDPRGKPFEVTVIRSTGNKVFEATATKAIEQSTFEPGSLDGKPIESGSEMKYLFVNRNMRDSPGANSTFIREYKGLMTAINSTDRAAADAALGKLKVGNLYEDAYFGIATYSYAKNGVTSHNSSKVSGARLPRRMPRTTCPKICSCLRCLSA